MTKTLISLLFLYVFSISGILAQNNQELQKMADNDQEARLSGKITNWKALQTQDSIRRVKVYELIENGELHTGQDYLNAGIIYQHGNDTLASKMAIKCFQKAIKMDTTLNRWWYAAAVDRDLMRRGKPQIYGTQYIMINGEDGKPKPQQYKMDTTQISDKERQYYKVPTLEEQRSRNHLMSLKSVMEYYSTTNSIEKTIQLIASEFEKDKAQYNVSESMINQFGYMLMRSDKNEEALKVFKLNTELYPKSGNVYDSYGECLLKLGKNLEAKKAYQKSLEFNPENENARNVLSQME